MKPRDDAITRADKTTIKFEEGDINDDGTYTGNDKAKVTLSSGDKTGSYSGKFFGKNATETAGKVEFNDPDNFLSTAFIGKKRNQITNSAPIPTKHYST